MSETIQQETFQVRVYRRDQGVYHIQMEYPRTVKNDNPTVQKVSDLLTNLEQKYPHLKIRSEYFESRPDKDGTTCGIHATVQPVDADHVIDSLEAVVLALHDINHMWQSGQIGPMGICNDISMIAPYLSYLQTKHREKDIHRTLFHMVESIALLNHQDAQRHRSEHPVVDENGAVV